MGSQQYEMPFLNEIVSAKLIMRDVSDGWGHLIVRQAGPMHVWLSIRGKLLRADDGKLYVIKVPESVAAQYRGEVRSD